MAGEYVIDVRSSILILSVVCLTAWGPSVTFCADESSAREYRLKAAFLHNFIMFVDNERFHRADGGAEQEGSDPNEPIRIGLLGKDPFGNAFGPLENQRVRNRSVVVHRFRSLDELADEEGRVPRQHPELERIRQCHVLFICRSETGRWAALLGPIRRDSLLTVGDSPGFLEAGGIINFLIEDKKVHFEINMAAAHRARLQIRSKLLRLAKRVVTHDTVEGQNGEGNEKD